MNFDDVIDRRRVHSSKWDLMQRAFGVSPDDGIAMWIADKDFDAPDFLRAEAQRLVDNGHFGYFTGIDEYYDAVARWMKTRHGWEAATDRMLTTFGLGNGIAMLIHCFTDPGDHVVTFTPVYHEFANKITAADRVVTELPLKIGADGVYAMDFDAYEARMTGREKLVLLCSPHNPAGRVWRQDELREVADFCRRHDLVLVSDEVHQDLTFSAQRHIPMPLAAPDILDRMVVITSASKTFSIAGLRTGTVTIPDPDLHARFRKFHHGFNIGPNLFGVMLTRAAYSPEGAAYVDELCAYIEGNARLFRERIDAIPGLRAMPMQSTYLAWVDFAGTGLKREEFADRIYRKARVAPTPGHTLGTGGESFMRFNIATRRSLVEEAVSRLADAFAG